MLFSYFIKRLFLMSEFHSFPLFQSTRCGLLADLFFLGLPVCSFFVLSLSSANHGHLIIVTSAWLTCKCMDAIFSKLQPQCEQLRRTWNSESWLKELLVVHCCCLIRVSQSSLFFPCEGTEIALSNRTLCHPRKTFCGCPNFREVISVWRPFLGFH